MTTDDDLQRRVARLETIARGAICLAAGALLLTGAVVPFLSYSEDGEDLTSSLLTFGFEADWSGEDAGALFSIGFIGLAVVAAAALTVLALTAVGATAPQPWIVRTTLALLVVGTTIALLLGLVAERNTGGGGGGELHATVLLFVAGVAASWVATSRPVATLGR